MDLIVLMNKWLNNAVIGVLLGVLLTTLTGWATRRGQQKAHRAAIAAEIEICRRFADRYLKENPFIIAPSYRLPGLTYTNSFPYLLADGALDRGQVDGLILFFNQVETLNRGLDQAHAARSIVDFNERNKAINTEGFRNRTKAKELIDNLYKPARDAVAPSRFSWGRWVPGHCLSNNLYFKV